MQLTKNQVTATGVKITLEKDGKTVGRAFLYLMHNDLHQRPFGFMEDVFVNEEFRGQGAGSKLVQAVIEEAKARNCYKLIGTSRHARENVHAWYEKLGFFKQGHEFRMNF